MFDYTVVYSDRSDFDGSYCVSSFTTTDRAEAIRWMFCDRLLDMQVSMNLSRSSSQPSAYDLIAF
jgi:hypothetical protein